jgi:hypothetical protein
MLILSITSNALKAQNQTDLLIDLLIIMTLLLISSLS